MQPKVESGLQASTPDNHQESPGRPARRSRRAAGRAASLTPEQRSLRGKLAAHTLHAHVADPAAHTAPARAEFNARFERQVDPDNVLSPEERSRRAGHARRAYFAALALRSARARSARATGTDDVA